MSPAKAAILEKSIGQDNTQVFFNNGTTIAGTIRKAEDIAFDIDTGCHLGNHQAPRRQLHHATLGDIGNVLALHHGSPAGKRDLFDMFDDFGDLPLFFDDDPAVVDRKPGARIEVAGKDDLARAR